MGDEDNRGGGEGARSEDEKKVRDEGGRGKEKEMGDEEGMEKKGWRNVEDED